MLSEGSGDFLICDEITSQKLSKIKLENNIATYPSNLPPLEIVFAAKDENLINEINNALGKLETKNTYELLYNKWYGVKEAKSASWYVYTIIAIIAAIIILLLFIIYILKKMVHKATLESKSSYNKILELNQSINFLIKNSNVEIFIYDDQEMMLYSLEGEDYIKKSLLEDKTEI